MKPATGGLVGLVLSALLCALSSSVKAQQPDKVYRIGFLYGGDPSAVVARVKAFRDGLYERGYVEGKNVVIETRYGEGRLDRVPALAAELVKIKVDVIVTGGPTDTKAAKDAKIRCRS